MPLTVRDRARDVTPLYYYQSAVPIYRSVVSVAHAVNIVTYLFLQFHQVVRSTTPIFVMSISAAFLGTRYSAKKIISLLPVIAGVGFA